MNKTKKQTQQDEVGNCTRGKRGNRTRKPMDRGSKPESQSIPKTNDSSWYTANAKLVEASARVPFPYRPGLSTPTFFTNSDSSLEVTKVNATAKIPGVFTIDWAPAVGISHDSTSPVSLAARDIFSKVRSAFSGSIQADAPDFIIHMMAMDSVYAYISHLKRIYKALVTFNADNQITPEVLLRAMGWPSSDIQKLMSKKVQLFGIINELISMTNKFYTPNIMPVLQRHVWMSERVYCDAPSVNSQMYLFNLTHVYKFGVDSDGAGELNLVDIPNSGDVLRLFNFGRELIEAISDWDDGYIINGYLTKAYDSQSRFQISDLKMDDRLEMVYNEVVLSQIENATCAPVAVGTIQGKVSQNVTTNAVLSDYHGTVPGSARDAGNEWVYNRINSHREQPSAIDTIEATRLMTKWTKSNDTVAVSECGTEIVTNFRIMQYTPSSKAWNPINVNNMVLVATTATQNTATVSTIALSNFVDALVTFSAFDWHPIMLTGSQARATVGNKETSVDYIGMLGDIHNITFISDEDMENINRCCLYSEFGSFSD